MDSKQKNGKIHANKISERKNPHTRAHPHQGAHVPPARAARACSNQAELRTGKWTASKRTGKSPQTKSQNAKIPAPRAQPHQGAHVPPARAACACSMKAELRTGKWTASKRTGKSPQTKSQNAKIPQYARNPHLGAHVLRTCCVRLLQPSRTQNENTPQAELGTKKNASTHANSIWAHTCPPARAARACSEKAELRTGKWTASAVFCKLFHNLKKME